MQSKSLILSIIVIGVIIAGVAVLMSHYKNNNYKGKVVVMSVDEYMKDGVYEKNYTTHEFSIDFHSLKPGDVLIIKDHLCQQPKYDFDNVTKLYVTRLTLCSSGNSSWPIVIYVNKDVTDKYKMGDLIEVKLHIKYYDFKEEWNGVLWHIKGELPEEAIINGKYSGEIVVPPSQVKKVG